MPALPYRFARYRFAAGWPAFVRYAPREAYLGCERGSGHPVGGPARSGTDIQGVRGKRDSLPQPNERRGFETIVGLCGQCAIPPGRWLGRGQCQRSGCDSGAGGCELRNSRGTRQTKRNFVAEYGKQPLPAGSDGCLVGSWRVRDRFLAHPISAIGDRSSVGA